ncbi:MAG: PAS domain S-box protein [candidate division NC10 bacterium]|nr:PAS domain S-box protein [candidate division NC10 bacterium]
MELAMEKDCPYAIEPSTRRPMTPVPKRISNAFVAIDQEGRFRYANLKAQELLSHDGKDLMGKSIWTVLPKGVGRAIRSACEQALSQGEPIEFETYSPAWRRWFETHIYPIPEGFAIHFKDTTERRHTERALRQSEQGYRSTISAMSDMIHLVDRNLRILLCNEAFRQKLSELGISANPLGRDLFEIQHFLSPTVRSEYESVLEKGELLITEEFTEIDAKSYWTETRKIPILDERGKVCRIATIIRDITERKRTEEALRLREAEYRSLVEDMPALVCRFRPDGTLTFVNDAYCRYFNRTREELLGQAFIPLIPEEDQEYVRQCFGSLNPEHPVVTYEHRVFDAQGGIRWQRWTDRALLDEQGRIMEYQSIGEDITDRKLAEEELRESEARYRALIEQTADGIYLVNAESKQVIQSNTALQEMLGYTREEMLRLSLYDIVAADRELIDRTFSDILAKRRFPFFERQYRRKDGSLLDVWVSGNLIS